MLKYSATIRVFHAPPTAVMEPVMKAGRAAGMYTCFQDSHLESLESVAISITSEGIDLTPDMMLKSRYQSIPRSITIIAVNSPPNESALNAMARGGSKAGAGIAEITCRSGVAISNSFLLVAIIIPSGSDIPTAIRYTYQTLTNEKARASSTMPSSLTAEASLSPKLPPTNCGMALARANPSAIMSTPAITYFTALEILSQEFCGLYGGDMLSLGIRLVLLASTANSLSLAVTLNQE